MPGRLAVRLLAALDHRLLWHVPRAGDRVYLTFDDGPHPEVTPWVLDTLAALGAKATFFCLGEQAVMHPGLIARIRAEGHALGHHTWGHADGWRSSERTFGRAVLRGAEAIGSGLFRPPYGHLPFWRLGSLHRRYRVVMWSIMGHDYRPGRTGAACAQHVLRNLRPGSIIVLHDNMKSAPCLREALVPIVEGAVRRGYRFDALGPEVTNR